MRLVDGAEAIRGDLPSASMRVVEVPLEAGDQQGSGVARCGSLTIIRDRMAEMLATVDGAAITIGGDCGVELAAIGHLLGPHGLGSGSAGSNSAGSGSAGSDVAVLWFDAHPDLNTPESSPSGAFSGMVLRTLLGDGATALVPTNPLRANSIILAGARSFDTAEDEYIASAGIGSLSVNELSPESLLAALDETGAASAYLHIDLDVLDPSEFTGLGYPEPFGLTAAALIELIKAVRAKYPLAGAGITEFAPASPADAVNDLPTILRIIGALSESATSP